MCKIKIVNFIYSNNFWQQICKRKPLLWHQRKRNKNKLFKHLWYWFFWRFLPFNRLSAVTRLKQLKLTTFLKLYAALSQLSNYTLVYVCVTFGCDCFLFLEKWKKRSRFKGGRFWLWILEGRAVFLFVDFWFACRNCACAEFSNFYFCNGTFELWGSLSIVGQLTNLEQWYLQWMLVERCLVSFCRNCWKHV